MKGLIWNSTGKKTRKVRHQSRSYVLKPMEDYATTRTCEDCLDGNLARDMDGKPTKSVDVASHWRFGLD